jgi:hypothetical protein
MSGGIGGTDRTSWTLERVKAEGLWIATRPDYTPSGQTNIAKTIQRERERLAQENKKCQTRKD